MMRLVYRNTFVQSVETPDASRRRARSAEAQLYQEYELTQTMDGWEAAFGSPTRHSQCQAVVEAEEPEHHVAEVEEQEVVVHEEESRLVKPGPGPAYPVPSTAGTPAGTPSRSWRSEPIESRTTLMLRNIPNKIKQAEVEQLLDESGFHGRYCNVWMPVDFRSRCNKGYAFIDFNSEQWCDKGKRDLVGLRFPNSQSAKVTEVGVAYSRSTRWQ
mmetsp:Transcript_20940/g.45035  ORF Transcript_20940/g.45035 Transcript_20940/m.45035 type:complete len:214 (+) Transcript_20940:36-677(+)